MKMDWKCIAVLATVLIMGACLAVPMVSANGYGGSYGGGYGGGYSSGTGSYQKYSVSNYGGDPYACYTACTGDGSYAPNQCRQWCNYYPERSGY